MRDNNQILKKFVRDQLSCWPLACDNFRALKNIQVREMIVGGLKVRLQFNPARMISSAAKLNKDDIAKRRCFLCRENRFPEQILLKFDGRKNKRYHILLNPYPIFPDHLVIAMAHHTDQSIWHRYVDMLDLARKYDDFTFYYNGPKSGASAPDHHHFQGVPRGMMPLENDIDTMLDVLRQDAQRADCDALHYVSSIQDARLYHYDRFTTGIFAIAAETSKSAAKLFYRLLDSADIPEGEPEPLINLISYWKDGEFRSIVIFRRSHRSHHYFSEGPDHLTMSPGCADMAGVLIVPVESEYHALTPEWLEEMMEEVSISKQEQSRLLWRMTRTQPSIEVGIMNSKEIAFEILSDGAGVRKASLREGKIEYGGALYDELYFGAQTLSTQFAEPSFILHGVTIGVGFHWERKEDQKFAGALKIIVDRDKLVAVNVVGVEDYLLSVISSEMSASASEEFLKAHAVISRSWVMAQIASRHKEHKCEHPDGIDNVPELVSYLDALKHDAKSTGEADVVEYVKWYDHEDHKLFDVCADDHCQRYQGLTRATGPAVRKAIDQTWGQVLEYGGKLCDARFSKCCGGVMEEFSACWGDEEHPYLRALPDAPGHSADQMPFCAKADEETLAQVLNSYDRETVDFYRWTVDYGRDEVSELISRKGGVDLGRLISVEVLERGLSGRIVKLKAVGSLRTLILGKELEIRRLLSESHLKSSAFEVSYLGPDGKEMASSDEWTTLRIEGRGWGHGVGLCQIGAAVMASEGYGYKEILEHYYPGSSLV